MGLAVASGVLGLDRVPLTARVGAVAEGRVLVYDETIDAEYLDAKLVRVARGPHGQPWGFYTLITPGRGSVGEAEIDTLFVDTARQGRGIERLLIEDARAQAARLGLRRIHIVADPPSEGFYRAVGACRVGEIPRRGPITWSRPYFVLDVS